MKKREKGRGGGMERILPFARLVLLSNERLLTPLDLSTIMAFARYWRAQREKPFGG